MKRHRRNGSVCPGIAWSIGGAAPARLAALLLTAACVVDDPKRAGIMDPVDRPSRQVAPTDTGTYLVLLSVHRANAEAVARSIVAAERGKQRYLYRGLSGFAISGISDEAAARIAKDPRVRLVERDQKSSMSGDQVLPPGGVGGPLWALDRIDVFGTPSFDGHFLYDHAGAGVHIYVLDTGVRGGHVDFAGRIGNGACILGLSWNCSPTIDDDDHGTGTASVAAGATNGVAKQAIIHPVRVCDFENLGDECWHSDQVAGLDWVMQNRILPAVATMSLNGYPGSFAVGHAITSLVTSYNVLVFRSAGNDNRDAYDDRGNRSPFSVIVGATQPNDARAGFSNWGATVSLMAPGVLMQMASSANDTATALRSGTSFAAPLAAGVAAAILSANPNLTPAQLKSVLEQGATSGTVTNGMGVANRVLYSRVAAPLALSVSILGPTAVLSGSSCLYSASVTGAPGPFSYSWTVDGVPFGGNASSILVTNGGASFDVGLSVSAPGAAGGTNVAVAIQSSAPPCSE